MEYNSFYGGRRGASFVIVYKYATIAEMIAAFSQGGNYKTVNYDEYVLIDTISKNNPDNGKIYRRGYDYTNEMGGAIYEGQIVGPAGMAPHTEVHTYNEVQQIQERDNYETRRDNGTYTIGNSSLVPGKYVSSGVTRYNDVISWACCSVKDSDSHESTAHIGFVFPYPVIDFTVSKNNDGTNNISISRTDDGTHPFYERWNINFPPSLFTGGNS